MTEKNKGDQATPVSATQDSVVNLMVNVDESSEVMDYEKVNRPAETEKNNTKDLTPQHKEESEKEEEVKE